MEETSGNALDSHGSNDLTETSGTIASATGKVGNCRDFEVADTEWFERADNAELSTGDISFTVQAWVNLESVGGNMGIVVKDDNAPRDYRLDFNPNRFRFFVFDSGNSVAGTVSANNLGDPVAGTWYHIIAWHDSANNQVGIAVNAGTPDIASTTGAPQDSTATFKLGGGDNAGLAPFDGLIDEVGLWKRVLTSGERNELYNGGNGRDYAYILTGGTGGTTERFSASFNLGAVFRG